MSWRKYSYWPKTLIPVQEFLYEKSEWIFRGCYWRWLAPKIPEPSSEEEIKYLEELLSLLRQRIKKIEERISELRSSKS
ncbi:MAG: hypothetical protein QN229_01850 [Desulfurococcaceae archaeon TW002]